jgi:hypothetical protein
MKMIDFLSLRHPFQCGISEDGRYWRNDKYASHPANELQEERYFTGIYYLDVKVHDIPLIYEEQWYKCITPWKILTKRLESLNPSLILQTASYVNNPHCLPNFRHKINFSNYDFRITFLFKTIDPRNPYSSSRFNCRGGTFFRELCNSESIQFFNTIEKGIYCKLIQKNRTLIVPNQ